MKEKVLITGAAGLIGGILRVGLAERYDVVATDLHPDDDTVKRADAARPDELGPLLTGVELVVDLAAFPGTELPWRYVRDNNIPATQGVAEAARRAGVRRIVFASSNQVTGKYESDDPYASIVAGEYAGLDPETIPRLDVSAAIRPDSPYAVGKAFGEAALRYYSDVHGISAICLRIGTVKGEDRPMKCRHYAKLLTHADLLRLVCCSLSAPAELRFAIFYGVSANTWRIWNIEDAREQIGYSPSDNAEAWRPRSTAAE